MGTDKTIHVNVCLNQYSYKAVRRKLSVGALEVFLGATQDTGLRARSVASELNINFAGIEVGTDVSIFIKSVREEPEGAVAPSVTKIQLEWEAADIPRLFPFMRAELSVYPLGETETRLDLRGHYEPPFGVAGGVIDSVLGHRIAEAAMRQFVRDIAAYLAAELARSD